MQSALRGVRSPQDAVDVLLKPLGYEAPPQPLEEGYLGLPGTPTRVWTARQSHRGYGVLIAELHERPRSLRRLGRRLVDEFHDTPLAILGIDGTGSWHEFIVLRPRLIRHGSGAVSVAKLHVDVANPTRHDVEIINGLWWDATDPGGTQERIDEALDVEQVTKRFYKGLSKCHQRLLNEVTKLAGAGGQVSDGIAAAGRPERVALRLLTQVLFCYFLQRKGLLEGDRAWLSHRFRARRTSPYYQSVLEPLFYEALALPKSLRQGDAAGLDVPFLNGGLFERHYGPVSLPLPDSLFGPDDGLLGFLDGWTFTVSEEAADEVEVAVDPEMLGKVFENLISEDEIKREGTVYTPRPVVQFMCREALVPYLQRHVGMAEDDARRLLINDDQLMELAEDSRPRAQQVARRIDDAAAGIRVLDPAVGSGAFLLGMMSELIRLRSLSYEALTGTAPGDDEVWRWKWDAIERSLFGVDINPTAVELCRLRLWLSLLVEERADHVHPLPNLEYRTVCADSLCDFVGGVEIQHTREGALTLGVDVPDPRRLRDLRELYFESSDPQDKARLREQLATLEDAFIDDVFALADENARLQRESTKGETKAKGAQAAEDLTAMRAAFAATRDRVFPLFLPAFHAPTIAREGGWDVVIMNPPYVGRKEVKQRLSSTRCRDLELHYGRTYDLMLHFAQRALELSRDGGVLSMIFNDSIFTSLDATDLRLRLTDPPNQGVRLLTMVRTRCFEGKAVNGGVVVAEKCGEAAGAVRWVENHGRPPADLLAASTPAATREESHLFGSEVGGRTSELWVVDRGHYSRLPHRPLFRPSPPALALIGCFERCAFWDRLRHWESDYELDFGVFSETKRLDRWKRRAEKDGVLEGELGRAGFVQLGLVCEGGQGLATADDRRFLAAVEGSREAEEVRAHQQEYETAVLARTDPAARYRELRSSGLARDDALVALAQEYEPRDLGWPRSGLIRVAPAEHVHNGQLSEHEKAAGIAGPDFWVPFEKGDDSDEGGGARWRRENPIVIDWSPEAVALLRTRANQRQSHRKPYFRNEHLWGCAGVTWNRVASYLRGRLVPTGSIFSDKTPVIRPTADWFGVDAMASLLNAPAADFLVRTFLGSRMQVEIGDIRRLPIPVLTPEQAAYLTEVGRRALTAKEAQDDGRAGESLAGIEQEIDFYVRDLYGIGRHEDLWVVR